MPHTKSRSHRTLPLTFVLLALFALPASAQQDPAPADDIIRVTTELVQTEVMVFDKQGHFVEGLSPEQFELTLAGTKQPVSFFERVRAGSASEAAQLAAARRATPAPAKTDSTPKAEALAAADSLAADRGRVIFFFLDDVRLSNASLSRARDALRRFVTEQMNPNDHVAIASTSGQIGFLQQLTDNPAVLNAAISRLGYRRDPEAYTGKTQISEYLASQIMDYGNRELFAYLMESVKIEQQMGSGNRRGDHKLASTYSASPLLRNRLRQVNAQGRMTTDATLNALQGLLISAADLPGRKLVFFLSDGFILNERRSGALEELQSATQAAARAGAVIYTVDLRSSFFSFGSGADASTNDHPDISSRKAGLLFGEIAATQEPLRLIADETGGRAILNPGSLDDGIRQAIEETSDYYVLAWRPSTTEQREGRLRLKVSIKDRPELRVRVRNSLYVPPATNAAASSAKGGSKGQAAAKGEHPSADEQLLTALGALYPQRTLPISLSIGYMQTTGPVLKLSMQTERKALVLDPQGSAKQAFLDVIGAAVDDRGIIVTFKQVVTIVPESSAPGAESAVVWNQQLSLPPGLYQVRVAVRERATGRTGGAQQWIEIPDAAQARLGLSSIFLGERKGESEHEGEAGRRAVTVDVEHKFARTSALRFQTYVYNAGGRAVWIRAQVFRGRQQVMSVAPAKVPMTGDPARMPYWAEIALDKLPPGHYTLQVTAADETAKATASQRINFAIE